MAALASRLPVIFAGCEPGQVAQSLIVYEPEWTIGGSAPTPPDHVGMACAFIRDWIGRQLGRQAGEKVRLVYGGSVAPEHVESLLALPELDGLGAGRKGRDPLAFVRIVQSIAAAKGCQP